MFRTVLFSEYKYYGKITIDKGASIAISKPWTNLLPAGIIKIEGEFPSGSIVGLFDNNNKFIGVGLTEYSSENLIKIMKHSSTEFYELIGYYHTNCAIKTDFLKRFRKSENEKWTLS